MIPNDGQACPEAKVSLEPDSSSLTQCVLELGGGEREVNILSMLAAQLKTEGVASRETHTYSICDTSITTDVLQTINDDQASSFKTNKQTKFFD